MSDGAARLTTPYFEVVKRRTDDQQATERRLGRAADDIVACWRYRDKAFIEVFDPPPITDSWWSASNPLLLFYDFLRLGGVSVVPVTALDRQGEYRAAFVEAVRRAKNGVAIRLYKDDLELPAMSIAAIDALAKDCACTANQVDVIINLERILPERIAELRTRCLDFVSALSRGIDCRSLTIIGTSIPESISVVPEDGEVIARRLEVDLWQSLAPALRTTRLSCKVGDYGVVRPEYVDRKGPFPHINGRLFYTLETGTLVLRGKSRMEEPLEDQYSKLARRVAAGRHFRGDDFSWGDRFIERCARWPSAPGDPTKWIAACTSHHVELVSAQAERIFATPPEPGASIREPT